MNLTERLRLGGPNAAEVSNKAVEAIEELAGALRCIVDEKADYMRLNQLGDPEAQHTVKWARKALKLLDEEV